MIVTRLFNEFFESEKTGGLLLIFVTLLSLILANSGIQDSYVGFWQYDIGGHSLQHWINDGLMTIFFLLIGLELEREFYVGELSDFKNATLPIIAAIGGMAMPALLFTILNFGTETQAGVGIPTATDIAFAIGILSLFGNRVPTSLKVFLLALAIIDDLAAILIIAVFYSKTLFWTNLLISLAIFGALLILNRLKVRNLIPYLIGGFGMWYFMLHSGVHATVTGVLLAFAIPFGRGDQKSTSYILQHNLHKPVAFLILPIFALANTCIIIGSNWKEGLFDLNGLGIFAGLVIGKPLGIAGFAALGAALGLCQLPPDINWKQVIGVGFLGGIGFTMSIFITLLAYDSESIISSSKIAVLVASMAAGGIGIFILNFVLSKEPFIEQDIIVEQKVLDD